MSISADIAGILSVKQIVKRGSCVDSLEKKTQIKQGVQFRKLPAKPICVPDTLVKLPYYFSMPVQVIKFESEVLSYQTPYIQVPSAGKHGYKLRVEAEDGCRANLLDTLIATQKLDTSKQLKLTYLETMEDALMLRTSLFQDSHLSYRYETHVYSTENEYKKMANSRKEWNQIALFKPASTPYMIYLKAFDACNNAISSRIYEPMRIEFINQNNLKFTLINSMNTNDALVCQYFFKRFENTTKTEVNCEVDGHDLDEQYMDHWVHCEMWDTDSVQYVSNRLYTHYEPVLFIPNAITCNKDGLNESWQMKGVGVQKISGTLYNRWGIQVHQFETSGNELDQEIKLPEGLYFYLISYSDTKGRNHTKKGNLLIIK